jgi:hypothetical protein
MKLGERSLVCRSLSLTSTAGYRIAAEIHAPAEPGPWPGVLLVPGTSDPGSVFRGWSQPLNAQELAATGLVVLLYDPAGRGESWGSEDFGGLEHQDNLRTALEALVGLPEVDPDRVGVVSISLGIAAACAGLAHYGEAVPAQWLLDWEGPCDREIITAGGRIMRPALGHGLEDEIYWQPREAVRHVADLSCGYLRIQAEVDHAQPGEFRHAQRMIEAAATGNLPWFRLNDHPAGECPASPRWYPGGRLQANRVMLDWIRRLFA